MTLRIDRRTDRRMYKQLSERPSVHTWSEYDMNMMDSGGVNTYMASTRLFTRT